MRTSDWSSDVCSSDLPIQAALRAEDAGADLITLHLREDRRHIQDADVWAIRPLLRTRMNLECAMTPEMLDIACELKPQDVCLEIGRASCWGSVCQYV